MKARCTEGHESDELDYCSVCGAAMPAVSFAGAPGRSASPTGKGAAAGMDAHACPVCGEARADRSARFCEVCRYDFVARAAGPPPTATGSAAPATMKVPAPTAARPNATPSATPSRTTANARELRWEVVVSVDPSLDGEPDPASPCPTDEGERIFPVDRDELLIGRRDPRRDIFPEIPLGDPGASRRHAKLVRSADGSIALLDLASANGTSVNGVELAPGARRALHEGDEVTLGRWTRIRLRSVP